MDKKLKRELGKALLFTPVPLMVVLLAGEVLVRLLIGAGHYWPLSTAMALGAVGLVAMGGFLLAVMGIGMHYMFRECWTSWRTFFASRRAGTA